MTANSNNEQQRADPDRYREALNESARLLRSNRPGDAVRVLEKIRKEHPNDPDIAINLGGALILQRRWTQAVSILEAATLVEPQNTMLWTNLAAAYLGRLETSGPKQQEKAIVAYERALQIDPHTPNVHYHLGLIHNDRGNLKLAVHHFQRAVESNPADKDARYWLQRIDKLLTDTDEQRMQGGNSAEDETNSEDENGRQERST